MSDSLKTVKLEAKRCPSCIIKESVAYCKSDGMKKCNYLNCPIKKQDDYNYGYDR